MAKTFREKTAEYLLSDGTLISLFDERRDGTKIGETADITYGYCEVSVYESYESSGRYRTAKPGRIVISKYSNDGFTALAKGGKVTGSMPSVCGGSENTKKQGLAVQYVWLVTKSGHRLVWCDVPSIINSNFTVQVGEQYLAGGPKRAGDVLWGNIRIWKVTDLRKTAPVQEVA
jgi:hypothetical protein